MRYALITNGVVTNVIEADAEFAEEHNLVPLTDGAGIGWSYSDGTFSPPAPQPEVVPEFVAQSQAKIALWREEPDGALFLQAKAIVTQVGGEALLWWDTAANFHRNNEWVAAIGAQLNLSDEQVDNLFRKAAKIV